MVEPFDFHSYLGIFTLSSVSFYRWSYICLHYIFNSLEPEHWQVVTSLLPITNTEYNHQWLCSQLPPLIRAKGDGEIHMPRCQQLGRQPHMCVFVIYTCALCCVLTGNTFSSPLLVGPDDTKLHQVRPSQAFRSRPIFSPNITQAGLRKFSGASFAPDVWLDIAAYVFAVTAAEPWDKGCGTFLNRGF